MVNNSIHVADVQWKHCKSKLFVKACELLAMDQARTELLRYNIS